ncbi:EAL domain-containing protein [Bosea sp. (in: a-proteobacteria)]|uniref:EAL domain-containing protein n=1 Tax=Bosea sp. (in: a-proteobacteria) TaxID=1871050 RepID=UPI002B45CDD4|nr:EAL domain-containing protein [Bosea sp. (in: a-proteobacteria)]WRH57857.1 MAG: EAL domain-containing protein [Bosea sp. (in: a-proteobacteria)]
MARFRPNALHPLASAVTGLAAGAVLTLLWPAPLGAALGLVLVGAGAMGSIWLSERRSLAQREQVLAAVGEVKVRLATNAIRLDALSKRVEQMPMRDADAAPARAAINELTAEVGLLGDLIHQVATTLADHDTALATLQSRATPAAAPELHAVAAPPVVVDPEAARQERLRVLAAERAEAARQAEEQAAAEQASVISTALSEGRVEVHLQPIVQLPQRRTRGYEALVRLRLDENTLLLPHEFIPVIEERGFGPTLDALVLTRALAIARHLGSKPGELFVSCNFSTATWNSSKALATLSRILDKYREHTGHLVVEMPQKVFRGLDPTSLGLLGAMSANGVRFALDELADLRVDPVALFDRGIRFVKAPAALLMEQADSQTADIAPSDLAALLARASVVLIADQVADDPTVADMIDLGVTMGQGLVFSPPRPVKPDVFAEPAPASAAPEPPPVAVAEVRTAEVVGYPAPAPPPPEAAPERQSFRSVLRRATA